jgi:flagellin-specific chaperone FliS
LGLSPTIKKKGYDNMKIKMVKIHLKIKDTQIQNIIYLIDDIKDHIRRLDEMVENGKVQDKNTDNFIKWFDWLEELCYSYDYRFLPQDYDNKLKQLESLYIDCKARYFIQ